MPCLGPPENKYMYLETSGVFLGGCRYFQVKIFCFQTQLAFMFFYTGLGVCNFTNWYVMAWFCLVLTSCARSKRCFFSVEANAADAQLRNSTLAAQKRMFWRNFIANESLLQGSFMRSRQQQFAQRRWSRQPTECLGDPSAKRSSRILFFTCGHASNNLNRRRTTIIEASYLRGNENRSLCVLSHFLSRKSNST